MKEYRLKEIYADFYENKGRPLAVVIAGSRAGLPEILNEKLLNYLKSNYNLLLLAYFGVGELPGSLERVPIEYFINSINLIKEENHISNEKLIIIGQSKGAEAALVLSHYMQSDITIACVGSCYVFQGLPKDLFSIAKQEPKSSWTYNNEELPYIKFNINQEVYEDAKNKKFCKCYENSIEKNFNKEACIDINNYKGKILLLSAQKDKYWPSQKMSNILLENVKNKEKISHISLDLEGHYFLNYDESVDEMIKYLNEN